MQRTEHGGLIVGLTGQTGAGKTAVSQMLKTRRYNVIDADLVAREVVAQGTQCLLDLAIEFGIEILNEDGTLNRRRLGELVFRDKAKRQKLNRITHPYILEEIRAQAANILKSGGPVVFLDAPTLFESGGDAICDKIVSVVAPKEIRLARIMSRDRLTEAEALNRINAQHDDKFYTDRSDFVIVNDGDLQRLRTRVARMLESFGFSTPTE